MWARSHILPGLVLQDPVRLALVVLCDTVSHDPGVAIEGADQIRDPSVDMLGRCLGIALVNRALIDKLASVSYF